MSEDQRIGYGYVVTISEKGVRVPVPSSFNISKRDAWHLFRNAGESVTPEDVKELKPAMQECALLPLP